MTDKPFNTGGLVLATLFLGAFVMGSSELLVVGLMNVIAADVQISVPTAGGFVTANALGLAVGGPLLTALSIKMNKRSALLVSLVLFIASNLTLVFSAGYELALAMRTISGASMGMFIALSFVIGVSVVSPDRMGRAIAVVISGVTVSTALGVPLGTLAGQALGWRGSFVAVVLLAGIAFALALALVPSVPPVSRGASGQARYAFAPRVLAMLMLTCLVFVALFAALTYIVPFLDTVTGVSGAMVGAFLLAYGVATAVGSFAGGRFADSNAISALILATTALSASLAALHFGGPFPLAALLALVATGICGYCMPPVLQYRVISLSGPGAALASSLPVSAANIGIAAGSALGGYTIDAFGVSATVLCALAIALLTIPLAWATGFLQPPAMKAQGPASNHA